MKADILDRSGAVVGSTELDDTVWAIEPNIQVMHQALLRQHANARLGTRDTKTRGEVRGGGRKPWRQKGTGRARQGSTRSPQWIGGGVVWGPHQRSFDKAMPHRMRQVAVRSALSAKVRDDRMLVVADFGAIEPKTKAMKDTLAALPRGRSVLIVTDGRVEAIRRAAGNLPDVWVLDARYLNVRDVLKHDRLFVTQEAVPVIESLWALPADRREPSPWKRARQERQSRTAAGANEEVRGASAER